MMKSSKGEKPVKVGDVLNVEIVSIGKSGDGIAKYGDSKFVIIVEGSKIGEKLTVRIYHITKNVAFAEAI